MLKQAASLIMHKKVLFEQQQTLSRECAESALTRNDLTENFLMFEEKLELLPFDITSAHSDDNENNNFSVDLS
jgi:hypothetical protein